MAAQRGDLGGTAVEDLGHLRVGLEERLGGDQEAQVAELLVQLRGAGEQRRLAAARALAEPLGLGPEQPLAVDRVDQGGRVELAEHVVRAMVDVGEADRADEVDELAEKPLVQIRPAVVLRQDALEARVLLLHEVHRLVEELTDAGLLGAVN